MLYVLCNTVRVLLPFGSLHFKVEGSMELRRRSALVLLLIAVVSTTNGCSSTPGLPIPLAPKVVALSSSLYTGHVYCKFSGPGLPQDGTYPVPMIAATTAYIKGYRDDYVVPTGLRALMVPVPAACQVGELYIIEFFTVSSDNTLIRADDSAFTMQPVGEDGSQSSWYCNF